MNGLGSELHPLLATAAAELVPASYAEKAMASLLQLHTELMDEKERRVDLYRRLMEREQAVAELRMYVKMLEEKLALTAPQAPLPPAAEQPSAPAKAGPTRVEAPRRGLDPGVNTFLRRESRSAEPKPQGFMAAADQGAPESWKVW